MATVTQCRRAFESLFVKDVVQPEKMIAFDIEQLRSAVQLCRTYYENQNEGVEAECDQNLYALPEAFLVWMLKTS